MSHVLQAWRLSVGTFTAIPVTAPARVTGRLIGISVLLAPLAVLPLAALLALLLWLGRELDLAPFAVAAAAVAVLALGTRVFHLDGLADTADGLTSSYDPQRAREVVKRGDTGPAGAVTLVLVLGVQVGAITGLLSHSWGPVVVAVLVCASRAAALPGCTRGMRPARREGLGASYAETVPLIATAVVWLGLTVLLCLGSAALAEPWWRGAIVAAAALLITGWLLLRARRRFGGMIGDVLGASVELSFAVMLLSAS